MSPDDPRHGTTTGYRMGCRDECCRAPVARQRAEQRKRYYLQRTNTFMVPSLGTIRRIQALSALGWSVSEVSRRAGYDRSHLSLMMRRKSIRRATAEHIAKVYEELSATLPPETTRAEKIDASRSRRIARTRGWLPPIWWDNPDDPDEQPDPNVDERDLDPIVVDRIVGGDFTLAPTATKPERIEVVRRWRADGRPLNELERLTGWEPRRYLERNDDAA